MEKTDVSNILKRIQANRQYFLITNSVIEEWNKVLEPYDPNDVNKRLDDYFKDSDNFGKYPDAYYITKYLKTIEEKKVAGVTHILCQICWKKIRYEDYKNHFNRCSSVEYITEMSKRYLNKNLNKAKLFEVDINTFENYYYSICKKIYNVMPDGFPKHLLENVLLTHEGKEINYKFKDVQKEMIVDDRVS